MTDFEKEYARLNKEQKRAVDKIDGPLLVVAGPGTGKTQLLGMRVANILVKTDTDPGEILCLTFTNKAAANMRDRLIGLAGSEARKVSVKTFHSFAYELMNQYQDYFWNSARLSVAPSTTQLEIVQDILARLPLNNPLALKFAGQYTLVRDVSNALKLLKEAGLTPDKLRALIKVNLAYIDDIEGQLIDILEPTLSKKRIPDLQAKVKDLPEQGIDPHTAPLLSLSQVIKESLDLAIDQDKGSETTKHVGKWKRRWIQNVENKKGMWDERKRNNWWLEVAEVYEQYRLALHVRGYYDYGDMLVEVLTQLEQHPDLLAAVQERYQYVLIDEFQDSNTAQLRLAHLVANHSSAEGKPNIMAVGDDDQSIFGFNGAELNNMLFFDRNYKDTTKVVLRENYRSSQAVLDVSAQIIGQAEDRLTTRDKSIKKQLQAVNEPKVRGKIQLINYPTREHQLSEVARSIKKYRKLNPKSTVAVLARSHASLRMLSSLLLKLDVPIRYEQQNNALDHEAVQQVILLCELVVAIQKGDKATVNEKLRSSLYHPMWQIDPLELWQLALDGTFARDWLSSITKNQNKTLAEKGEWLLWLAATASHQPLALTLEFIIGLREAEHMTSPIKNYFAARQAISNDYLQALSALRLLRELVNEFSAGPSPTLNDFVDFVSVNRQNGRTVTDESPFVSDKDAIELYTVHKAKGLEFDAVYIIDGIEDNWRPKPGGRKPPANLPLENPLEQDDDYARLLYVAASRAKHTLIATSYDFDHAGKELLASPLLRTSIKDIIQVEASESLDPIVVLEESLQWPRLDTKKEKELLRGRLESFSINVSNLLNFLDVCNGGPQYFFERNILRLPEAKTPTLAHGTASHAALELAQKLTNTSNFSLKRVKEEYGVALKREHLPAKDFERYLAHGQNMLEKLFQDYALVLPKNSKSEQQIKGIKLREALVGGKLDRIDYSKDHLIIVDYKTGRALPSFDTKDQAKAVRAWRQRTQLIFYALLAKHHPLLSKYRVVEGQMVYIEAPTKGELVRSMVPTEAEIGRLENLIEAIWIKVKNLDLPDVSKYSQDIDGILKFEEDLLRS